MLVFSSGGESNRLWKLGSEKLYKPMNPVRVSE